MNKNKLFLKTLPDFCLFCFIILFFYSQAIAKESDSLGSMKQDSLALIAFYYSTNGDGWKNNSRWLSTNPVSTWHGVTVTGGRVTKLDLGVNNLTGTIPPEFGNLTSLIEIRFASNQLTGPLPPEIGNLVNLDWIWISHNQFTGVIPKELSNLKNLKSLELGTNQLSGEIPPEIGSMDSLTNISLENNQLTGEIPPEFGNLKNLFSIRLSNNQLTGSIPEEIWNLTNLVTLSLDNNDLFGELPAAVGNLTKITELSLRGNNLFGSIPKEINNLTRLYRLKLSNNNFVDFPALSLIKGMRNLNLENNRFTFEDIEPNIGVASVFRYSPQDSIGSAIDTVLSEGDSLSISFSVGGSANLYQWYKSGLEIQGAVSDTYTIESFSPDDAGIYELHVTNQIAKDLTILSRPIKVTPETIIPTTPRMQDSLALVALYNSTDGVNWKDNTNWLSEKPFSEWYGVTENEGRIVKLDLSHNYLEGEIPLEIGNLTEIVEIDLNSNYVSGPIPQEIGLLKKLRKIYFQACRLSGSIPKEIGNLENLTILFLHHNFFTGSLLKEITCLPELHHLLIEKNNLSGIIPKEIGNMTNMVYLQMGDNQFTGPIPSEIGNLTKLKNLLLGNNDLSGTIPPEIGNCKNLENIHLHDNQLYGAVPEEFVNLTNMSNLDITNNYFEGLPDFSAFNRLHIRCNNNRLSFEDLEPNVDKISWNYWQDSIGVHIDTILSFGDNLEISIPVGGTANYYQWYRSGKPLQDANTNTFTINTFTIADTGIYHLQVTNSIVNNLTLYSKPVRIRCKPDYTVAALKQDSLALVAFYDKTGGPNWENNTRWLSKSPLGNWHGVTVYNGRVTRIHMMVNGMKGSIPPEIGNLTGLEYINLDSNKLTGPLPPEFGNLINLKWLSMSKNLITALPPEFGNLKNLESLDLSVNPIPSIPPEIKYLKKLKRLDINYGPLTVVPPEIGSLISLEQLELNDNKLTTIPPELGNLENLTHLRLQYNRIKSIPQEIGNLPNLTNLILFNNLLTSVPIGICNIKSLEELYLGQNQIESIPDEIGRLSNLEYLAVNDNKINKLPSDIKDLGKLRVLYLYSNSLTEIPGELFGLTNLEVLNLHNNKITGFIPKELGNLKMLIGLSLSDNLFTGSIPTEIGNLTKLKGFSVSNNKLSGDLPAEIGNLTNMYNIDLSNNELSGKIPEEFANLRYVEDCLYLHNNRFTGIPDLRKLTRLKDLRIENNWLTFDEIEKNIGAARFTYSYSPQAKTGNAKKMRVSVGDTLIINGETGGSANQYQWYKEGELVQGADFPKLYLHVKSLDDFGAYYVKVSNSLAPDLVLQSKDIRIIPKLANEEVIRSRPDTVNSVRFNNYSSIITVEFNSISAITISPASGNVPGNSIEIAQLTELPEISGVPEPDNIVCFYKIETPGSEFEADITFSYTDEMLEHLPISESDLKVSYFNDRSLMWITVPGEADTVKNTIKISTNHFSIWSLGEAQSGFVPGREHFDMLPEKYQLGQNFPNPFNSSTQINFHLPEASKVTLTVYNILGQEVARLVDDEIPAGYHSVKWDASGLASGTYISRFIAGKYSKSKKMLLIK